MRPHAKVGIGSMIWRIDGNRRVYKNGERSPDIASMFFPTKVVGETRVSWVREGGRL